MNKGRQKQSGFTLIELLVVIAVIALLMAVIIPALGKAKLYAQKIICRNNIRQQCLGILLYSDDNDTQVPIADADTGALWLWDLAFWSTSQISNYAGFGDQEVFFCPANEIKVPDDARFWQFSWCRDDWGLSAAELKQPQPIRDEDVPSCNPLEEFRVMPILFMFERPGLPDTLEGTNLEAKWINKISEVKGASATLMVMDNVVSENQDGNEFFEIQLGDTWTRFGTFDNSNHRSNQRVPGHDGYLPDGANVGFVDGHVDWRNFEDMQAQTNLGGDSIWFWW